MSESKFWFCRVFPGFCVCLIKSHIALSSGSGTENSGNFNNNFDDEFNGKRGYFIWAIICVFFGCDTCFSVQTVLLGCQWYVRLILCKSLLVIHIIRCSQVWICICCQRDEDKFNWITGLSMWQSILINSCGIGSRNDFKPSVNWVRCTCSCEW